MKGHISIPDFIHQVKAELIEAQERRSGDPFYALGEVTLEVSFAVDFDANAKMKLYVVELGTDAKAQQVHKVSMKFMPLEGSSRIMITSPNPDCPQ
ncbi:hypothetical protein AWB75_07079 [Caballeronia catudaia]|uniref:Trypsin-co-occurring domain-containing protein n=1 Tax=Caballeronia catudaia TaxID=1777136 RepID=A0A158DR55_9BURK|nr:trypco2 family protein [Caballeronia catudaia]SAK97102.1 hypothetical protein AWB75_07079 [Caballeronia catudaia]